MLDIARCPLLGAREFIAADEMENVHGWGISVDFDHRFLRIFPICPSNAFQFRYYIPVSLLKNLFFFFLFFLESVMFQITADSINHGLRHLKKKKKVGE